MMNVDDYVFPFYFLMYQNFLLVFLEEVLGKRRQDFCLLNLFAEGEKLLL